jgi:hypothetical protein
MLIFCWVLPFFDPPAESGYKVGEVYERADGGRLVRSSSLQILPIMMELSIGKTTIASQICLSQTI